MQWPYILLMYIAFRLCSVVFLKAERSVRIPVSCSSVCIVKCSPALGMSTRGLPATRECSPGVDPATRGLPATNCVGSPAVKLLEDPSESSSVGLRSTLTTGSRQKISVFQIRWVTRCSRAQSSAQRNVYVNFMLEILWAKSHLGHNHNRNTAASFAFKFKILW